MKKIILYIIFVIIPFGGYCQSINEQTAQKVAEVVLKTDKPNLNNQVFEKKIPVGLNNDTLYYIFTYPGGGFAIISADSSAPPVLGHCKTGEYDTAKMPSGLLYLLNSYKYWIDSLRKNNVQPTTQLKEDWAGYSSPSLVTNSESGYVISPMLQTQWGQDYNEDCPSNCPAGCTAVAMAQILKYWACRINPTGYVSYDGLGYIGATAYIGAAYYDWKDMSLYVADTNNELLIFNAGASCRTHYNHNGSESTPKRARNGFVDFWGISSNADVKWRISHLSNWNDMIKNELFQGRPVLYSGGSLSSGGHSWVIDGYENGLFWCNWGWDGDYDGLYSIGKFNTQNGSFNQLESAIFNVYPVKSEGVAEPELTAQTFSYNPEGYTITIPDAFGATSYQWSCSHGTIQGSGTSATLFSDCNSTVSVKAYNSRCQIYSYTNSKLISIKYGPITGSSSVCSSSTIFTLNNRPTSTTVSWLHSSNLNYISGQGTDNYTVQAASSNVSGTGWVKAIISSSCGNDTIEKNVWVGVPSNPSLITTPPLTQVGSNSIIQVMGLALGAENYNWTVAGGTITSGQGTSNIWIQTVSCTPIRPVDLYIQLVASNSCGNSARATLNIPFDCSGGPSPLLVSPNPASQTLNVEVVDTSSRAKNQTINKAFTVQMFDPYNKVVFQKQETLRRFSINVNGYRPGIYYLRVIKANKVYAKKIIISPH